MRVLSFDLATRCGWANGVVSPEPDIRYGTFRLKDPSGPVTEVAATMGRFMRDICYHDDDRPGLVVVEAPIMPFQKADGQALNRNMTSIILPHRALGAIEGMCAVYGIRCETVASATIRKSFIGRGNFGSKEETKAAVVKQCISFGYVPDGFKDEDAADAIAGWHHAALTWGNYRPARMAMFPARRIAS